MKLRQIEVMYVDAFTRKHGLTDDYVSFMSKHLSIASPVPPAMSDEVEGPISARINIRIPFKGGRHAGGLNATEGTSKGEKALILQLFARHRPTEHANMKEIEESFDRSHQMVKQWFESICSAELVEAMGPRIPIKG